MMTLMIEIMIDIMMKHMTMTTTMIMIMMIVVLMEPTYQPTCGGILMVFNAFHLDNEVSIVANDPSILYLHSVELS
jgi:hypothetical protein